LGLKISEILPDSDGGAGSGTGLSEGGDTGTGVGTGIGGDTDTTGAGTGVGVGVGAGRLGTGTTGLFTTGQVSCNPKKHLISGVATATMIANNVANKVMVSRFIFYTLISSEIIRNLVTKIRLFYQSVVLN
jgi:hypothetical protein